MLLLHCQRDKDSVYCGRLERYRWQRDEFMGFRTFNFSRAYAAHRAGVKEP